MQSEEIREKLEDILPKVSKPTRYLGNEMYSIDKDLDKQQINFLLAFPDIYEVGMSHLGIKILYHLLNEEDGIAAERVYTPWFDLEEKMRELGIPLFSLESKEPAKNFDIIGFTLQYELSYSNILNMLDLANIPLESENRTKDDPLLIAGGPCAANPEPIIDFFDVIVIGEAEELIKEVVDIYSQWQKTEDGKEKLLHQLAKVSGIYIPSFYDIRYNVTKVNSFMPKYSDLSDSITKRVISDLDESYYPTQWIVPYMDIVHDRINLEVARGCSRSCRFCQAGMIYRPVRERSQERLEELASNLIGKTGYEELGLTSLSTSDYSQIKGLTEKLVEDYSDLQVGISLPSLRAEPFSVELGKKVQQIKKTGLTFAPEAGTQRLRDVINKGVTEKDLIETVQAAYDAGWKRVKLYFMIGLPTETEKDLAGIVSLAKKVAEIGKLKVKVSVSTFIPKPHTPFQWVSFNRMEELKDKIDYLKQNLRGKGLSLDWNDPALSLLEAAFSRGDRRLNQVLIKAWQLGAKFEGWSEHFDVSIWRQAFKEVGLDLEKYVYRDFNLEARLPWDHIEIGVTKDYLRREYNKALAEEVTLDCRSTECSGCGVNQILDVDNCLVGGGSNNED
ncbi:TIGR03960 family B12-binding radical SAM protein [Sporohalobacter salinus]|uniref:TIGR03960 family B12-binding radical SAM protein n=1 Tax=Sporohalobacter salinus TaxID=1494606 RepID=UPI001960B3F5|nr:TIGR03960 family B12-binding radical SAM protein [Sporohalobacter salinus]MBM7623104.1 radical SAM family uncharacterized protein [Sporohalobacter salinus]